ncbi:MAG: methylenetetrahydrofolate reductase [Duncaniella sp.]|nr:methylenetetrahydrofolate reductase [Duncaniella sp.]
MRVIDHLTRQGAPTAFSFEILPPLKGNNIDRVFGIIDKLREFDPKYINITSHRSENIYVERPDGTIVRSKVRKRPGTVAIASAIQNRYGITAVPHIICKGFTREETEYALIDLNFLGVHDLLLLQGDAKGPDKSSDPAVVNFHATDLQEQVNRFNEGFYADGTPFEANATPFSYGMACYPEKHEAAPNMESDLYWAKRKVAAGAQYLVTQMFFDNSKYFAFVDRCRREGINVPIIPGVKPIISLQQLTVLPRVFRTDIPEPLAAELRHASDDAAAAGIGVEWAVAQCKELIAAGVPSIHFYTFLATDSVRRIASRIY